MNEVWVEKYRPKSLDEIVGQDGVIERLKSYVKTMNMPHLMFAGPAGTGKTTSALALTKEMFGENWKINFHELNASDERGIDVVRNKIKAFARTAPIANTPFKVIFLDEADSLTPDAQAALRRTMEKYTNTCRFMLSCNYSSKIIDPIQSRCAVFRFKSLNADEVKKYLRRIAMSEKLEVTEDGMDALLYVAKGDLRRATNIMQVSASLGVKIDAEAVYKTSSTSRPEELKQMLGLALAGKFIEARNLLDALLINYGLSGQDIVYQIHRNIFDLDTDEHIKIMVIEKMGETEFRIIEGSNPRIQIEALLAFMVAVGQKTGRR